jgi:hypothetical protein
LTRSACLILSPCARDKQKGSSLYGALTEIQTQSSRRFVGSRTRLINKHALATPRAAFLHLRVMLAFARRLLMPPRRRNGRLRNQNEQLATQLEPCRYRMPSQNRNAAKLRTVPSFPGPTAAGRSCAAHPARSARARPLREKGFDFLAVRAGIGGFSDDLRLLD